jgi:hypothetical protein
MRGRTGQRARAHDIPEQSTSNTDEGCECANRAENGADDAVDGTDGANKGHCGEAKAATDWGTTHACHWRSGCSPCRWAVLLLGAGKGTRTTGKCPSAPKGVLTIPIRVIRVVVPTRAQCHRTQYRRTVPQSSQCQSVVPVGTAVQGALSSRSLASTKDVFPLVHVSTTTRP